MNRLSALLACVACPFAVSAADVLEQTDLGRRLNLEAHGFVSFGYLQTTDNDWLGETTDGTNDFYEAAANVIARPFDRLRIGAQLFTRDLGPYDNGRVELDWAYADYRAVDSFGFQLGRYKIPLGLYNESLDVDAARTSVFLDSSIYAIRSRDLYISADGAKLYGLIPLGGAGSCDYAVHIGAKKYSDDGGFATYLGQVGFGDPGSVSVESDWLGGAMVHWNTPISNLAFRLSFGNLHNFHTDGTSSGVTITSDVADYSQYIASILWDPGTVTLACEYTRYHGQGTISSSGVSTPYEDHGEGGYLSTTWHILPWLDVYGAGSMYYDDRTDHSKPHSHRLIAAIQVTPINHLSIKCEFEHVNGTAGILGLYNPNGAEETWNILALKTTVDF